MSGETENTTPNIPGGDSINSWRWRRVFLFGTQLYCMATIQILIWKASIGPVAETIAWGCLGCLVTNCGSYVFGAVWESNKARTILGKDGTAASLNVPMPPKPAPVVVTDRRTSQPAATPVTVKTEVTTGAGDDPVVGNRS